MRAAVREHVERGVDVIKIMASGGTMTPGTRQECAQFDPIVLRAAVDEAHRHGLPVTAHAPGTPAADAAGNVKFPNVNPLIEMTDMRDAQRSYEANLNIISATRRMIQRTLDILKA